MPSTKRVLIIDDDEDIRDILVIAIAAIGYDAEAAEDGIAAIHRLVEGEPPDLVLLDLMMPRMDGESFLAAMRENPATADIPVIIISGHGGAREKAVELGAEGCLVKPIELDELSHTLKRTLQGTS